MTLVIDGHNLIGALPGIRLGDPDDEERLLARLRAYRAASGGQPLIVFFDSGDAPTRATDPSSPGVQVRFARPGQTADDAIVAYLAERAQPGQYAVVTNDGELARRVREVGASLIRASDFSAKLGRPPRSSAAPPDVSSEDPHDPAYADLFAGFVEAERRRAFRVEEPHADIATWIEQLYGDDLAQAQRAARWLGQQGAAQGLPALRDALTHHDVRVRAAALLALGDLGEQAALPDLCDRLAHDAGSMAREAAAQSLGRIGDRSVEPALELAVRSDGKSKVRKAAQAALLQIRARRG